VVAVIQQVLTRFRVGDRVQFRLGADVVVGAVVEDFGRIGPGGQQIVRVQVALDPPNVQQFEMPASLLEPAQPAAKLV
jgi:hypothetical protein